MSDAVSPRLAKAAVSPEAAGLGNGPVERTAGQAGGRVSGAGASAAAVAAEAGAWPARLNTTERHFLKALAYTGAIVFVFWLGYAFERNVLGRQPGSIRFIREASEAAMRYITIPHIVIGFLFMWSSPRNRNLRQRLWAVGLLATGAGLCVLYGLGGGRANFFLYIGVYLYFLVHELRDEAMFYSVLGDAAPVADRAAFRSMVRALTGLIVLCLAGVLWLAAPWGTYREKLPAGVLWDGSLPVAAKVALSLAPLAAGVIGLAVALRRYAVRLGYADVRGLARAHATLLRVMFGVAGVIGLSLLLTQRGYSLILFHVVAWYIFAGHQFARHPPSGPPQGLWLWMRTTRTGFRVLHIGMVMGLMAIGLVWTLWLGQSPWLAWLLKPEAFLYWTIMHITVSFVPR